MDKFKQMKKAFLRQKYNAKRRNIPWKYNLEEWICKWEESGKWELRGPRKHQYVMCRYNDEGPYSYYNTKIDTAGNNKIEADKIRYKDYIYKVKQKIKEGKGRPFDSGKCVIINGVTYPTITKAALELKIPRTTLTYRLKVGYYK